ncbi:hypothetical protein GGR52DRAFT_540070 [Hypoxylon sp. FL1284]|nr:hypothetical protein GGR52DRAFT_540070 [Hypoxylon sp. FL1284]
MLIYCCSCLAMYTCISAQLARPDYFMPRIQPLDASCLIWTPAMVCNICLACIGEGLAIISTVCRIVHTYICSKSARRVHDLQSHRGGNASP